MDHYLASGELRFHSFRGRVHDEDPEDRELNFRDRDSERGLRDALAGNLLGK